ncbi:hypothetical protein VPHD479_0344 [Vibrio phage D479]
MDTNWIRKNLLTILAIAIPAIGALYVMNDDIKDLSKAMDERRYLIQEDANKDTRIAVLERQILTKEQQFSSLTKAQNITLDRINNLEVANAKMTTALENLTIATNNLTKTTNQLVVTVGKLESKITK